VAPGLLWLRTPNLKLHEFNAALNLFITDFKRVDVGLPGGNTIKMETVRSPETLVSTGKCTQRYNPAEGHRYVQRREDLEIGDFICNSILAACR
jgi:hypothetical protein